MIEFLSVLGEFSMRYIWIPLGLWTLVAIPLVFLSRYLSNRHPAIHYHGAMALLLSLPVGFFLMPLLTINLAVFTVPDVIDREFVATAQPSPVSAETTMGKDEFIFDAIGNEQVVPLTPEPTPPVNEPPPLVLLVGVITLLTGIISALSLVLLGWKTYKLKLLRRTLKPVEDKEALNLLQQLKLQFTIRRHVDLRLVPANLGPMTFGGLKPVIGLPQHILKEPDVLRAVLYHELIHVQRFDYITGWFTRFICAIFVFHPVVVYLTQQVNTYRELSCDSAFLEKSRLSPADYALLLLRFSTHSHAHCSIPMVKKTSTLKKRIKYMSTRFPYNPFSNRLLATTLFIFLFLPAFFVACTKSTTTGPAYSLMDDLERLEAQVAYLRAEINVIQESINHLRIQGEAANEGIGFNDPQYDYSFRWETDHQFRRKALLDEMLIERMRDLEFARMDVATSEWIKHVNE